MKNFINKVQELGKKAAEIKQAVQGAPAKAAELRQAVVMSAAELHQIRSDVQSNLQGLRINNEERLLFAMRQVNDAALTFEEAGYELSGVDLDLSLPQRLSVHLQKFEDVPHSTLQSLVSRETREMIKPILAGILKAEETAANVEFTYLNLTGVIIHVGAVPVIRMCWRTEKDIEAPVAAPAVASPTPPVIAAAAPAAFGSFFERRETPAPTATTAVPTPTETTVAAAPPIVSSTLEPVAQPSPAPAGSPWSTSALDRFKKMPDLSKHRR